MDILQFKKRKEKNKSLDLQTQVKENKHLFCFTPKRQNQTEANIREIKYDTWNVQNAAKRWHSTAGEKTVCQWHALGYICNTNTWKESTTMLSMSFTTYIEASKRCVSRAILSNVIKFTHSRAFFLPKINDNFFLFDASNPTERKKSTIRPSPTVDVCQT